MMAIVANIILLRKPYSMKSSGSKKYLAINISIFIVIKPEIDMAYIFVISFKLNFAFSVLLRVINWIEAVIFFANILIPIAAIAWQNANANVIAFKSKPKITSEVDNARKLYAAKDIMSLSLPIQPNPFKMEATLKNSRRENIATQKNAHERRILVSKLTNSVIIINIGKRAIRA